MPSFDLRRLARAQGVRRNVTLRPIQPTQAAATDLAAIYAPAWRIWSQNIDRILAAYDPKPLGDALTLDSPDVVQRILDAIAGEFMTRLVTEITPGLRTWRTRAERIHRDRWASAVKAGTGVDLSTVLTAQPVTETLEAWLNRNVALVTNISDQAQARIADAVFRAYDARLPAREVAKELREAVGLGRKRALRVAADQSSKLSAALDAERMAEAGIALFKWRHSGKLHPRDWHKARDGKVYELKSGKAREGDETIPSDDRPGMQPWCGCRAQAYLAIMDEMENA
jgi:SPP1 gp7 family putative phage head morphogenesis protein